jgi:hypothetical protein
VVLELLYHKAQGNINQITHQPELENPVAESACLHHYSAIITTVDMALTSGHVERALLLSSIGQW